MTAPFVSHRGLYHHSVKDSHHRRIKKLLRKLLSENVGALAKHIPGFKQDDQSSNFDGVKSSSDTALVGDTDHSVDA